MPVGGRRSKRAGALRFTAARARDVAIACEILAFLGIAVVLAGVSPASGVEAGAPAPVIRVGTTEKICQLTGDTDWETGRPTAARTFANFGLDAADLGYPIEHDGKLILLFGDSWPPPHGGGAAGEIPPDDAVGFTTRREPPGNDGKCLEMQIHDKAPRTFAPATIIAPPRIKQGFFNVPSGGVSAQGGLFGFFWTDHCSGGSDLGPSLDAPLARPKASPQCPETEECNSIGRNVLARSDDDGRTFHGVVPMPLGFVYVTAVNARQQMGLPEDQRLGVFVFGAPRYRASVPYLALAPIESFADVNSWRFFVGRADDRQPLWASRAEWTGGGLKGPRAETWQPPGKAEIFAPVLEAGRCIGEFSVTWNPPLRHWLMVYQCAGGVFARIAPAPWGPWSLPTSILGPADKLGCRLVMVPEGCGNRRDFWPTQHKNGSFVGGGTYAPYVLNRYTTADESEGPDRSSTIYWVVSTWNPYEVSVMRTTLHVAPR
jgi:hypothetical protein